MRRTKPAAIPIGAALVMTLLMALSAAGASTDDTKATFVVTAGTLDVTVPETATIRSDQPGTVITVSLGVVSVTVGLASADASWTAAVTATNFSTHTGTGTGTTLASGIDYWSGPAITATGNGTFTPGQAMFAHRAALDIATPLTAFTHTGGTGNNTATWNPNIAIQTPWHGKEQIYVGTVTHSVA